MTGGNLMYTFSFFIFTLVIGNIMDSTLTLLILIIIKQLEVLIITKDQ